MLTSLYKAKSPEILALKYNFNNGTIITDSYNDVIKESKVWTKFRTSVSVGFSSRIHTQTNKNILKESMEQARQNNLNYIKSCIKENYPAKLR